MKRIGIDARLITQTGVGTYIKNIISLFQKKRLDYMFYIYLLPQDFDKFTFNNNFIKRKINAKWHSVQEQTVFLRALYKDKLDLVHFPYFSYPVLYRRRFISTVHDLTPLIFKTGKASTKSGIVYNIKHFIFRHVINSEVRNSTFVITPSYAVRKMILNTFGKDYSSKIFVSYEGVSEDLKHTKPKDSLKEIFNKPFIFYLGNFYPHKNVEFLIRVFNKVKQDIDLVLVGPTDFFYKKLQSKYAKLDNRIKFYSASSLSEIVFFYKNARALVHPSLFEGFGLTLLEAMYFGCPVIASRLDVFEELYKGNYVPFNPHKESDLYIKLNNFLKGKYKSIIRIDWKKFSFENTADITLDLYKRALS